MEMARTTKRETFSVPVKLGSDRKPKGWKVERSITAGRAFSGGRSWPAASTMRGGRLPAGAAKALVIQGAQTKATRKARHKHTRRGWPRVRRVQRESED
jgi:hypothetical protein